MMSKEEREQEGVRSQQAWNAFSAAAEDKIGGGHVELFCSCTDQHQCQVAMDSLFRKKSRPRQSSVSTQDQLGSVPYDKILPSPRSPLSVPTVNHGFRGISAPNTNPSLSVAGTEFNKYTVRRTRPPTSPDASISTADSSTLYDDPSTSTLPHTPQSSNVRRSEALSFSSSRSSTLSEATFASPRTFAAFPTPARPPSSANRVSKYSPSLAPSEVTSHHSHTSSFYLGRNRDADSFYFPRPETDEEIEILFENLKRTRDFGEVPNMSIEQKWQIVHSGEQMRWMQKKDSNNKPHDSGQPPPDSPEWYISKFLDKSITAKQAAGLSVSLRSHELG
jgi:cytokinesis protein